MVSKKNKTVKPEALKEKNDHKFVISETDDYVSEKKTVKPKHATTNKKSKQFWIVLGGLALVLLALGLMQFRYLFTPATVNGSAIYMPEYWRELNRMAGSQALDQLVTERLINEKAKANDVTVSDEEIEAEFAKLEEQFKDQGLDDFLQSQGLSRDQVKRQLVINLKIQKLLAEKVAVTNEEIKAYLEQNKEEFKEVPEAEAKQQVSETLKNQKLQTEVSAWIQQLKSEANIMIYLPGLSANDIK